MLSATEKISDGSEGILMEAVLEGMAEYYSAELSEKVIRGMTENALKRKYNGGILPIGYTVDSERHLQIDPLTAPAVVAAFARYADGGSMKDVADEMNAKGIRSKFGKKISIDSVTRMLRNRRYIGEFRFRDIFDPNGVPAIVPKELFDRVQERMVTNKKAPGRHKADDEYLLTTKLICGKCERFMVGESGKNSGAVKYRYYKCSGVKNHKGCDKKTVRKDWIENLVIERILRIVFDDALVDSLADSVMELQAKENTAVPLLQKQYAEVQRGIDNLLNAIQQGIITSSTKERLDELEKRKSELSELIVKEEMEKPLLTKEQIVFWFHRFRKLNPKKLEHRRRLIDSFINAIYLYDDRMLVVFNYKDGTETVSIEKAKKLDKTGKSSDHKASALP